MIPNVPLTFGCATAPDAGRQGPRLEGTGRLSSRPGGHCRYCFCFVGFFGAVWLVKMGGNRAGPLVPIAIATRATTSRTDTPRHRPRARFANAFLVVAEHGNDRFAL
jgi:hypothetical protein